MKSLKIITLGLVALFVWSMSLSADVSLYLVRHAEKQKTSNPPLTEVGKARAATIAVFLKDRGIQKIYSTNYVRTLETAAPSAKAFGKEVELYDPRALADVAKDLKAANITSLVVGHSNTTMRLLNHLTGESYPDLKEHQYDLLFEVKIADDGTVTHQRHYIEPRTPE
jgi:broad specificity phosphatase PhoE